MASAVNNTSQSNLENITGLSDSPAPEKTRSVRSEPARQSDRIKAKTLAANILSDIDTVSKYHLLVIRELGQSGEEFSRLSQIRKELKQRSDLSDIVKLHDEYKSMTIDNAGQQDKAVVTAIDRVIEDRANVLSRVEKALSKLTAKSKSKYNSHSDDSVSLSHYSDVSGKSNSHPDDSVSLSHHSEVSGKSKQSKSSKISTNAVSTSGKSKSAKSQAYSSIFSQSLRTSNSSRTSTSSRLREMAIQSRATLAEKEAKLQTEIETLRMEEEMAELERQKEAVQRSIRSVKARGELDAERKKHMVLLQAVEEEIASEQVSSLLQRPKDTALPQEISPSHSKLASLQDTTIVQPTSWTKQISSSRSDDIARDIKDHIHISLITPSEPKKFSGDPLEYPIWKASFDSLIGSKGGSPQDKLNRLRSYVEGEAYDTISGYFLLQTAQAYNEALNTLDEEFGKKDLVEDCLRDRLETWPKIGHKDVKGLRKYSNFIKQCLVAQSSNPSLDALDKKRENRKFIKALPEWVKSGWLREMTDSEEKGEGCPPFSSYVKYVAHEVKVAINKIQNSDVQPQSLPKNPGPATKTSFTTTTERTKVFCAYCQVLYHNTIVCQRLGARSDEQKDEFVRTNKLCYSCLEPGHMSKGCENKARCDTCHKQHPTSMHQEQPFYRRQGGAQQPKASDRQEPVTAQRPPTQENKTISTNMADGVHSPGHVTNSATNMTHSMTSSMTVPVWLSSAEDPSNEILVYALLDTQSDSSYITDDIAAQVSANRKETTINLSTMTSSEIIQGCQKLEDLCVRAYKSNSKVSIKSAYTTKSIPAIKDHIPTREMVSKWPHLQSVADEMKCVPQDTQVGLLIGYDTPLVFKPLQCISSTDDEPYATKTPLGWVIMGTLNQAPSTTKVSHRVACVDIQSNQTKPLTLTEIKNTHKELNSILNILSLDFKAATHGEAMSMDDKKFLDTLTQGIHQDAEGYITMPLPWKSKPRVNNSRVTALRRFNILETKMTRDKDYQQQYHDFMEGVLSRGEAEKVPEGSEDTVSWYLPHFEVYHPKKPKKISVVFDASAKVNGSCLNDHLLDGPKHINNLHGILLRFRKEKVAIMCDIEKMFHNFRVLPSDRDYFRFLWYDKEGKVADYRMRVHIFGAKSSPGCATFGLRQLANSTDADREVTTFIAQDFYVDDGLTSTKDAVNAQQLIKGAREVCQAGNVRLHKFVSNDSEALAGLPSSEKTENATKIDLGSDLNVDHLTERTLGLQCDLKEDAFKFTTTDCNKPSTRRGVLSTVASLFDPLGLVSPYILQGKLILQALCKEKTEWDEPLSEDMEAKWNEWKKNMEQLHSIRIPRCYKTDDFQNIVITEIHNFSDASTSGYGQCSYLRLVDDVGNVHISLLLSKARVAPLKVVSIPRMELQAACTSVEVGQFLKEHLQIPDLKEFYWTYSKVVLAYINNDSKRFHIYVANRVQKIRDCTEPAQWNYIPTDLNPADIVSCGATPEQLATSCWFKSPEFLKKITNRTGTLNCRSSTKRGRPRSEINHSHYSADQSD